MKVFEVLILLLAIAGAHGRTLLADEADECNQEDHCRGPKTPKFEVVGHHGATEIRQYANATWAVSVGKSVFGPDVGAIVAAKGLVAYFSGANNEHRKLPRSVPLITTILRPPPPPPPPHKNGSHPHPPHPHNGSHPEPPHNGSHPEPPHNGSHPHPPHPHPPPPPPPGGPLVLVGAYVDTKGKAPVPDFHRVKLVHTNSSKVYSHQFGGFAISWFIKKEIGHLKADLKDLGIKPCKGKFFVASYDGPWKWFGRKNEVWWTERPHRHHHNDTEGEEPFPEDLVEMVGFDQFDPMYLFPEEMELPPLPEGTEEPLVPEGLEDPDIFASMDEEDFDDWQSEGIWTASVGKEEQVERLELV